MQKLLALFRGHLTGKAALDLPVSTDLLQALPVAYRQARQVCGSQCRCFNAAGPHNVCLQQIRLELHQEIIRTGAAIHPQLHHIQTGIPLHRFDHIIRLISHRFHRSPDELFLAGATGNAYYGAAGILLPVGCAQPRKGRYDVNAAGVLAVQAVLLRLR